MNTAEIAERGTVHVRICCKDWELVRSTIRLPLDSSGEQQHASLGCVVDFPGLTLDQWAFLRPELDRVSIAYDYIAHTSDDAQWVNRLTSCS